MDTSPSQELRNLGGEYPYSIRMTTMEKRCWKCNELKPLNAFGIDRALTTGRRGKCKACGRQRLTERGRLHVGLDRLRTWRARNPDRVKEGQTDYYKRNPERIHAKNRAWRERHPEYKLRKRELARGYYAANREKICEKTNDWHKQNRAKVNSWARPYLRLKRRTNENYRLRSNLRRALNAHIRGKRVGSTMKLTGCSLEDLWLHLETQFKPGWTRENYAKVWEIDHIIPLDDFDLSRPEHQKRAFHFSNLRPLTIAANRSKRAKIITNQFQLL